MWYNGAKHKKLKRGREVNLGLFDYEVKRYFMKSESYFSVPLPPYFDFTKVLADTERAVGRAVGKKVAQLIGDSQGGRTVGIPQGSLLIDFIAEMVLGYIDVGLHYALASKRKEMKRAKDVYKVVRFRDDYRIFAKDEVVAREALKILSDVLARFELKLSAVKTKVMDDIVAGARKEDKKHWEVRQLGVTLDGDGTVKEATIQKNLLAVYDLSLKYPNSGSVVRGISRNSMVDAVLEKAKMAPGREYLEVNLQRLTIKNKPSKRYLSDLCRLAYDQRAKIWNSEWISIKVRHSEVVNHKIVKEMKFVVPVEEINVFDDYNVEMEKTEEEM